MKKLIWLLPVFICCSSTTNTFYLSGELLPQDIHTKCITINALLLGTPIEHGPDWHGWPYYGFCIFFPNDSAELISIDSLNIISFKKNNKIDLIKNKPNQSISDSTYHWVPTGRGGYFLVNKSDSLSVSFVINSNKLSCSEKQIFILIPTKATDKQISKRYEAYRISKSN